MIHVIKLINSYFWKSYFGVFFAFIFPIILLGLLGSILGYYNLFSGTFAIPSTSIALVSMPVAIFQFKNSVLFKRIGISTIKPYQFIMAIGIFYFVIMLFATLWCMLFTIILFNNYWNVGKLFNASNSQAQIYAPALKEFFIKANWGGFLFGLIINIIIGITVGIFLLSVCKNMLALQALGTTIMVINQFLSCQVLPVGIVNNNDVIKILCYFSPFKYSTGLIIESITGNWTLFTTPNMHFAITSSSNIFDVHSSFYTYYDQPNKILIFNMQEKIANLVAPFGFIALFSIFSIKTFKWMVR